MKKMAENVAKCAVNMRIRGRKSDKNKQNVKECCQMCRKYEGER